MSCAEEFVSMLLLYFFGGNTDLVLF
jgi:hypothetical protein